MKFKVGDKVRLTREAILRHPDKLNRSLVLGGELLEFNEGFAKIAGSITKFQKHNLELVLEEPEFKHGDIIEVSNNGENWFKRMFIAKTDNGDFIATDCIDKNHFTNGWHYLLGSYKYARKVTPQLTRKEIAEKFGIDKDFIFIDE